MNEFEDFSGDSGSSDGGSSLWGNIIQAGTALGTVALEANANPVNVASLQGFQVSTPGLQTYAPPMPSSGSGLSLILLLAVGVGAFLLVKKA